MTANVEEGNAPRRITRLLKKAVDGERDRAFDELRPLVHEELGRHAGGDAPGGAPA